VNIVSTVPQPPDDVAAAGASELIESTIGFDGKPRVTKRAGGCTRLAEIALRQLDARI
jgi:hypothetical protein